MLNLKNQKGFTLIELMIVVAIIGILAAIALPAYNDYILRSKVTEGILTASQCRTSVAEVYQSASTGPGANNWGCGEGSTTTQYVSGLATDVNGVVTVTLQAIDSAANPSGINNANITLTPIQGDAAQTALTAADIPTQVGGFVCDGSFAAKYRPGSCRG